MSSPGETVTLKQALDIALKLLQTGQFGQAEIIYQRILEADSANPHALHFLGVIAQQQGKHELAADFLARAVTARPDYHQAHNNLGVTLKRLGRTGDAIASFRRAIELKSGYADAYTNLGIALQADGRPADALEYLLESAKLQPEDAQALFYLGNVLRELGKLSEAAERYARALELAPGYAPAANNLGGVLKELGRFDEAEKWFQQALLQNPRDARACFNLGVLSQEQQKPDEAMRHYRSAVQLDPAFPDAHNNLGSMLRQRGQLAEAADCFRKALGAKADHAQALNNMGTVLQDQGKLDEAKDWYARALESDPRFAGACINLGIVHKAKGRLDEAIRFLQRALELEPGHALAYYNLGNALAEKDRRTEAIDCFRRALESQPDYPEALCGLVHQLQHICDWTQLDGLIAQLRQLIREREDARIAPFAVLGLPVTPEEQLQCAKTWARIGYEPLAPLREKLGFTFVPAAKKKLRIGYLSADFRVHPVAYLTAGLFELHDRTRFEIHAYSCGPDDDSAIRRRLEQAFDSFKDVRAGSFEDIARTIYADGIDILVDLTGHTQLTRTEVLALRPAPVQVNFLGFPGTMGAAFIDYIVADESVIPRGHERHYVEKVAYLPCYQPNDHRRTRPGAGSRAEYGVPEGAFVFCCFNQTFKILPPFFDIWMRLLKAVPDSVLWLSRSNTFAVDNLRSEAARRGIEPQRLLFAPPTRDLSRHYAGLALADLFLDTLPFNANATASDALWCGVPVLTCTGETFISRAAGSVLEAAGLPELITHTLADYERRALELARSPHELAALRQRIAHAHERSLLFDSEGYVRSLESAYQTMWDTHAAGKPPDHFRIPGAMRSGG